MDTPCSLRHLLFDEEAMNMLFTILGTFQSMNAALLKSWIFLRSCRRFGDDPVIHGTELPQWPGYRAQKVDVPLKFYEEQCKGYTHVFYTDACDCLMLGSFDEVKEKYRAAGSPPFFVSGSKQLGNVGDSRYDGVFKQSGSFPYPNVGGYIAEIPAIIETFRRFLRDYTSGDDCFMWYDAIKDGWWNPVIDDRCQVWHVNATESVEIVQSERFPRLRNTITGELPCIIHMSGGYFDPEYCRDEAMLPWAWDLGIVERGKTRDDYYRRLR